jgi:acyl-CoA synthetase (AMP-forming)/AMP-acid ligase II
VDGQVSVVVPGARRFDPLSYLRWHAAVRGSALAVYDRDRSLTFADLLRVVGSYMAELQEREIGPGDVVAVSLPNVWQYVAAEIAIPAVGAVLMPLPISLGQREVSASVTRAAAKLVVTSSPDVPAAHAARSADPQPAVIGVDELRDDRSAGPTPGADWVRDPGRIVQIALTSGTTGLPKLASLSARLKQLTFEGFTGRLGFVPGDRMMPMSPITQGVGEMCLYALRTGAALVMTRDERFSAANVLQTAAASRATFIGGVPTMLGRLAAALDTTPTDLGALRATICAGAALSPALAEHWEQRTGSVTCSFYGAMDIGQLAVPRLTDPPDKRWTTVGHPHDAAEWQITDPAGNPAPPGVEGEICMRGPLVQTRYWNDTVTPFAEDGWAHFGDLGYVDEDGFLHVTGRIKDTIIRGGNNVNPLEVENLLRQHPRVLDAAVVGIPDSDLGERSAAFIVARPGPALELADLTTFLGSCGLARYKWPERLFDIDILPTATTGKLDRARLRALACELAEPRSGGH